MDCEKKSVVFEKWKDLDHNRCVVDFCLKMMDACRKESCGKDVLCREGTWQVYEIIKDITEGNPQSNDYELLMDLLEQIKDNASCEMSRTAASTCMELMIKYEDEWDKHIRRKRCTNLVCKGSYTLYIDPQICDGCGICLEKCPQGAIVGGPQMIHVIDTKKCNKSLICMEICPKDAIKKAGTILPKLPKEPVPVGSFNKEPDEKGGMRRRRRRRKE